MQPFDLVIRGGTVATATDSFKADVGIRGTTVAAIGEGPRQGQAARSTRAANWCCPAASTATATSSSCRPPA